MKYRAKCIQMQKKIIRQCLNLNSLFYVTGLLTIVFWGALLTTPALILAGEKHIVEQPQQQPETRRRRSPLVDLLKDGIPENAVKRARLRENFYALLASSDDEKFSKQVQKALVNLYMTSGSPTVDLLMRRSVAAIETKKYAKAVQLLDTVVKLAPDYAEGWNQRAFAYYRQNKLPEAVGDLRRVLALDANHFRALEGLATILRETGDETGSYRVFKRLIEVHPQSGDARAAEEDLRRKIEGRGI